MTGKKITLKCEYCRKEFELLESVKNAREKNSGKPVKYCSLKCYGLANRNRKMAKCKNCGSEFETTRNNFCSVQCVREFRKRTGQVKKQGYWFENGYKVISTEDGRGIKEHIKIMEEHIGRKLAKDEHVHHINGEKTDNRIENLKLMKKGDHSRLHRLLEKSQGKHLFGGHNNN